MHVCTGPAKLEGTEEGAGCLSGGRGCPAGRGAAGAPPDRGSEGATAASSRRAVGRDWAVPALVAVG